MLDQFFELPFDLQPDINECLSRLETSEARRYLCSRLVSDYRRGDSPIFQEIFSRLGVDGAKESLAEIVGRSDLHSGARATALELICGDDPDLRSSMLGKLDEGERRIIVNEPLRELIADAIEDIDASVALAFITEHFPADDRLKLEEHVEELRRSMGASAATVYGPCLRSKCLDGLHVPMIDAIVDEGRPDGARLFEELISSAETDECRIRFEEGKARHAAVQAKATVPPLDAVGRLGPMDASGNFEAALIVNNADGTKTLAVILIHDDDVLDGFVDYEPPNELLDSGHVPRLEVSSGAIAGLVMPIIERAPFSELDSQTRAAVRLFERLGGNETLSAPEPAESVAEEDIEGLMSRREYALWAFTPEDFHAVEIPEPPPDADAGWIDMAVGKLNLPGIRSRIARDADFMSRWHQAAGEQREATILARIARDVHESFCSDRLVRQMVRRSLQLLSSPEINSGDGFPAEIEWDLHGDHYSPERASAHLLADVVETQVRDADPPAAKEVFEALCGGGLSADEARGRIATVLHDEIIGMMKDERPHDARTYEVALRRLLQ